MADNYTFTPGSGATGASDDIAGVHHPRVKVEFGADGSATDVSHAAPLPVTEGQLGTVTSLAGSTSGTANTWTTLAAASTSRRRVLVQNTSDATIELGFGSDVAMVRLSPGDSWQEVGVTTSIRVRCPSATSKAFTGYSLAA